MTDLSLQCSYYPIDNYPLATKNNSGSLYQNIIAARVLVIISSPCYSYYAMM